MRKYNWPNGVKEDPTTSQTGNCAIQQFTAIPLDLNRANAPKQTIEMTTEHFHFTPDEIHVKQGTFVSLRVKAIDGTHGFKCSHFCGLGHLGMNGKVIIE